MKQDIIIHGEIQSRSDKSMKINIQAKQAGRKNALFEKREIEIAEIGENPTLENLIKAVVKEQLEEFNAKPFEKNLLSFLSKSEISDRAATGKVGFAVIYNENKADLEQAQETAILAFTDGLFCVFAGDEEIKNLSDKVRIQDSTLFTFIRLTFLAGSYW